MFLSDPFVKIQLVHGLKLTKTKKTSCMRGTIDPFYNESFSFKVPQEELENASLVFTGKCAAVIGVALLTSKVSEAALQACSEPMQRSAAPGSCPRRGAIAGVLGTLSRHAVLFRALCSLRLKLLGMHLVCSVLNWCHWEWFCALITLLVIANMTQSQKSEE